jgi:hypothetical protein
VNDHASRTKVESKGCHAVVGDQGGEKHRDSAACPMCDPNQPGIRRGTRIRPLIRRPETSWMQARITAASLAGGI